MPNETQIKGAKVQFYGSKNEKPCGVQFIGKDALGNMQVVDFEIYSPTDLGIRKSPPSLTMAGIDPKEFIKALKEGFKRCGI